MNTSRSTLTPGSHYTYGSPYEKVVCLSVCLPVKRICYKALELHMHVRILEELLNIFNVSTFCFVFVFFKSM